MRARAAVFRAVAVVLVPGQVLLSAPLSAQTRDDRHGTTPAPPSVKVNRTLPKTQPAPAFPVFSTPPTDIEILRARVFDEPLVAIGGNTTASENDALANALMTYLQGGSGERVQVLAGFLEAHPTSAWRGSLLTNLGVVYRRTGYFSKALSAWEEAWSLTKSAAEPSAKATADRALGELAELNARLGRYERLEDLFREIADREVVGGAKEKLTGAREGLWLMRNKPENAFRCGPMALDRILASSQPGYRTGDRILQSRSTLQGTSLVAMQALAAELGLKMQMAKRETGAAVLVPAMVHWKAGHFAALVRAESGRYLMQDPTFGDELWVSQAALDEEASGYALVPEGKLPEGWRAVGAEEAGQVWGKGATGGFDEGQTKPLSKVNKASCDTPPMAVYSIHLLLVSLHLTDTPVGYSPPRGPSVQFRVTYNQREAFQPQIFTFSNFGPRWTFDWLSYVEDDPINEAQPVRVFVRGGGSEVSSGYVSATQSYAPHAESQATVVRTSVSPIRYERRLPDGSVEVFTQADGAASVPRRVFMTESIDPQGNALSFVYDASLRMVAVQDAIGQVTTLSYENASDPLKITRVTDPFGREAAFQYDASGRLVKITDVIGITSEFTYESGDFINTLTTPYRTTSFRMSEEGQRRWLEATDPLGGTERVEFRHEAPGIAVSDPPETVPSGVDIINLFLQYRNTFYWDKRAMATMGDGTLDYTKARLTHWLHTTNVNVASGVPESEKMPLQNRVWYNYPGQTPRPYFVGTLAKPTAIGRVLDDGSSQVFRYEYANSKGNITREIDPLGREKVYEYDANEIDLLRVKVKNGAAWDLVQSYTYNAQHQPLTVTDGAGQTTTYTYTPSGQILTVTTPPRAGITEERTTTYSYESGTDRLLSVTGPGGMARTNTYDGYGRLQTTTDPDNYTVTYEYDFLDRPTRTTYPDGSYEEIQYERLDPARKRDRMGRWTHTFYDQLRRVAATRDPANRTVTTVWCDCGSLDKLVDPNGNATRWKYDLQGRVTKEIRADGSFKTFVYEGTTSRLKKKVDAKLQEVQYSYAVDDKLLSTTYFNAEHPTPNVTFSYTDPATSGPDAHGRLRQMVDGTGTTVYSYHPFGQLGAGQLASVDGPLADDTVSYGYDELGRLVSRSLNGVTSTWAHDQQGRLQTQTDPIGTFSYTYQGVTGRVATVSYPNGQTSAYSYFPVAQDLRLQEIHHKKPDTATLSKFNYTYDAVGNIKTWTQQTDSDPAKVYDLDYDRADQLVAATLAAATPKRYRYAYDPAGNRTAEQMDDVVTGATYNNMNRLLSQEPGGALLFRGTVNEPATVTVAGQPAAVSGSNVFTKPAAVPAGTSTVEVKATDSSGNVRTNVYEVSQAGAAKSFTHDQNGNLTTDGSKTYEWDAENRLIAVNQGTQRTEFTYSGSGDRVEIIEKTGTTVLADRRFVPCDGTPCEERDAGGSTVKRFFEYGVQQSGTAFYYLKDHLGSIVALTDATATVRARYDYDPFGRRVKVNGDADADLGFTGHLFHPQSGLDLALYRSYDASLGRWISPDSLSDAEQREGPNLYAYVANRPTVFLDFLGLERVSFTVITIIRPNAYRPGAKSWHRMFVDTASGAKTRPDEKWIGYTEDPIFRLPVSGAGSLEGDVSGGQGCISLYFKGVVKSFFVPMPIDYFFIITYSSNSGHGRLRGRHDAYPSYTILKDRKGIYDFQQRSFWDLRAGAPKAMVDKPF